MDLRYPPRGVEGALCQVKQAAEALAPCVLPQFHPLVERNGAFPVSARQGGVGHDLTEERLHQQLACFRVEEVHFPSEGLPLIARALENDLAVAVQGVVERVRCIKVTLARASTYVAAQPSH